MKNEHQAYLDNLGVSQVVSARVESVIGFYNLVSPEEILDIYISEYITEEGIRVYESLWLFTANYAMEAQSFVNEDSFDMVYLNKCVGRWEIKKKDFDFIKATDASRMTLRFDIVGGSTELLGISGLSGNLKGSKDNCDYLKTIFLKYVLKNQAA